MSSGSSLLLDYSWSTVRNALNESSIRGQASYSADLLLDISSASLVNPTLAASRFLQLLSTQLESGLLPHLTWSPGSASAAANASFPSCSYWSSSSSSSSVDACFRGSSGLPSPPLHSSVALSIFYALYGAKADAQASPPILASLVGPDAAVSFLEGVWPPLFAWHDYLMGAGVAGGRVLSWDGSSPLSSSPPLLFSVSPFEGTMGGGLSGPWVHLLNASAASAAASGLLNVTAATIQLEVSNNTMQVFDCLPYPPTSNASSASPSFSSSSSAPRIPDAITQSAAYPGDVAYTTAWCATACLVKACDYNVSCALDLCGPLVKLVSTAQDNAVLAAATEDLNTISQWLIAQGDSSNDGHGLGRAGRGWSSRSSAVSKLPPGPALSRTQRWRQEGLGRGSGRYHSLAVSPNEAALVASWRGITAAAIVDNLCEGGGDAPLAPTSTSYGEKGPLDNALGGGTALSDDDSPPYPPLFWCFDADVTAQFLAQQDPQQLHFVDGERGTDGFFSSFSSTTPAPPHSNVSLIPILSASGASAMMLTLVGSTSSSSSSFTSFKDALLNTLLSSSFFPSPLVPSIDRQSLFYTPQGPGYSGPVWIPLDSFIISALSHPSNAGRYDALVATVQHAALGMVCSSTVYGGAGDSIDRAYPFRSTPFLNTLSAAEGVHADASSSCAILENASSISSVACAFHGSSGLPLQNSSFAFSAPCASSIVLLMLPSTVPVPLPPSFSGLSYLQTIAIVELIIVLAAGVLCIILGGAHIFRIRKRSTKSVTFMDHEDGVREGGAVQQHSDDSRGGREGGGDDAGGGGVGTQFSLNATGGRGGGGFRGMSLANDFLRTSSQNDSSGNSNLRSNDGDSDSDTNSDLTQDDQDRQNDSNKEAEAANLSTLPPASSYSFSPWSLGVGLVRGTVGVVASVGSTIILSPFRLVSWAVGMGGGSEANTAAATTTALGPPASGNGGGANLSRRESRARDAEESIQLMESSSAASANTLTSGRSTQASNRKVDKSRAFMR